MAGIFSVDKGNKNGQFSVEVRCLIPQVSMKTYRFYLEKMI